jgi:ATP-dependent protease HslVU (ClpYQ) peptidase subunit
MTCIAAVVEGDRIWMGGDSAFSERWSMSLVARANQKVFRNGPFLIGVCGSARVLDVLRYTFKPPKQPRGVDVSRYMRSVFIDAVRAAMKDAGVMWKENNLEEIESSVLVGYRGRLFCIEGDFQVGEAIDDFSAVGSGGDVALGALTVTEGVPARKRLLAALGAAERYNAGVRRPFYVQSLEGA